MEASSPTRFCAMMTIGLHERQRVMDWRPQTLKTTGEDQYDETMNRTLEEQFAEVFDYLFYSFLRPLRVDMKSVRVYDNGRYLNVAFSVDGEYTASASSTRDFQQALAEQFPSPIKRLEGLPFLA